MDAQVKQEFDETAEQYGGKEAYKQAKADGKTVLNYRQWVQVRTPSFKAWFGDWENDPENASKVVNPDTGEPRVMYRGSPEQLGHIFEYGKNFYGGNRGFWFAPVKSVAQDYAFNSVTGEIGEIKEVFLSIKEPLDLTKIGKKHITTREFYSFLEQEHGIYLGNSGSSKKTMLGEMYHKHQNELYNLAYDGNIIFDDYGHWSFIAKNPEQIKSATDNIGTFDRQNPDIRFDLFGLSENDIATIENDLRIAKCLQGEPVAILNDRLAPHKGMAELRLWATEIFNAWDNHAISPEIGRIELDKHSVNGSIAHKMNPFKAEAFRSIKSVIEQGVVVSSAIVGRENHFFISAPVTIENKEDIVTVLVKQDMNTQRMYLHSVMTKENILNRNFEQANKKPLNTQVSIADTKKVSEPHSKLYSRATPIPNPQSPIPI